MYVFVTNFVSTIYHKEKCTYSTSTIFQAFEKKCFVRDLRKMTSVSL